MIFGIDLGTTNSLIGIGDTLLTGLISSNVDTNKKKQIKRDIVSDSIVSSYKTDMSMGTEGQLAVQCSAIILKELARLGERRYGEKVEEVVISVPAYFSTSQREAVYKAAEIAGLTVKALINEPTAAALYLCRDIKDLIVVYDLGGGTFDVSIVDSRTGTYSVIATDGIVLGGDDLDIAMVNAAIMECKIPIRFRSKQCIKQIRNKMRLAKEEIQKTRSDVYVDLSDYNANKDYILTENKYKKLVREVFGRTINMTNFIVNRNIPSCEKPKVVFVGGSSNCPYLKEMLKEEIEIEEIESDINSDLVVARGVAIYAEMMNQGKAKGFIEDVTKRLCIEEASGKSITIIESNTIIPCRSTITVSNSEDCDKLRLKLYQGDSIIAKNNSYIGTLIYDYGHIVNAQEGIVEVTVEVSADGIILLSANEILFGDEYIQKITLTAR